MSSSRGPLNRVMGAIVPRAVDALDPADLLERLDLDALLARIDLNLLLDSLDLDPVLERLDLNRLMERVDVDALVSRVDVNRLVDQVDVEALVQRVDVNRLVDQVDVGALVQRVDVDSLVGSIDLDQLVGRIDLNALLTEVDVAALAARAGIDQLVADATTGMAARTLDLARRQILRLDLAIGALIDKAARRAPEVPSRDLAAGPLARTAAFLIDTLAVSTLFGLTVSMGGFLLGLFTARDLGQVDGRGPWWTLAFGAWWFLYLWLTVGVSGRTIGKGLVGLRVGASNGEDLSLRSAALRAITLPASMVLGLGLIPAVVGRDRRALHDRIAGSQVTVDWGPRPVALPLPRSTGTTETVAA